MDKPLVAVVVVGWNSRQDLPDCLTALSSQDYPNYKTIFVDNASTDDSVRLVEADFPQVTVIRSATNSFFTGGHNLGMRHALDNLGAKYIAIINPDTTCDPNWIAAQVEQLENEAQVAAVGPKVLFAEGYGPESNRSHPGHPVINTVGIVPGGYLFPYDAGSGETDIGQFDTASRVYALSGVSIMFRAEALREVGLFFGPFQMYLEDVDLCLRLRQAGWEIMYTPNTTVYHKHMRSTSKQKSGWYTYYSRRNYIWLMARHFGIWKVLRSIYVVWQELGVVKTMRILSDLVISSWKSRSA